MDSKKFEGDAVLREQFKQSMLTVWNTYQECLKIDNLDSHLQSKLIAEMKEQEMTDAEIVCELMNNEYTELKMLWPNREYELEWGRADVNAVMLASNIANEEMRVERAAEMKQIALDAQEGN